MYKTLHKKQGSVTVQLRFARSSVTFCAKRDIIFGGRLGEYKYYDMDKVIASAMACAKEELNML